MEYSISFIWCQSFSRNETGFLHRRMRNDPGDICNLTMKVRGDILYYETYFRQMKLGFWFIRYGLGAAEKSVEF